MTDENRERDWTETKYFWICLLIELILIIWNYFYRGASRFPEQYSKIWDYFNSLIVLLVFLAFLFLPLLIIFSSKKWSMIIIILTIFIWIVIPIYDELKDEKWQCYDRTTYNYKWNNDVKCINKHWETKWMSYSEVKNIAPNAVSWWIKSDTDVWDDDVTKKLYNLINEHMYNSKWECIEPYNVFDKERDAYYWYELSKKISDLELDGIKLVSIIDNQSHSFDFRFWERYRASAIMWYIWCLHWCWLIRDTKEYDNCVFWF